MIIKLKKDIVGNILDLGGGGEGIISLVYPGQVIAMDNRLEELEEAPEGPIKIVMDAGKMTFASNCIDNVTAFYSLMYMLKSEHTTIVSEIRRVLKPGGHLYIWDVDIEKADPFIIDLEIDANGILINTTYGVGKEDAAQNSDYYKELIKTAGFKLLHEEDGEGQFYQCWEKID